jgi:predicted ATPase
MIQRVQISNYRCFSAVNVPLGPMTVLIGANNSGKSAFLSALNLVQEPPKEIVASDRYLFHLKSKPLISITCDEQSEITVSETFEQSAGPGKPQRKSSKPIWKVSGPRDLIMPIRCFGGDALAPVMTSAGVTEKEGVPEIDNAVTNLPAVLDSLLRRDRTRFDRILKTLAHLIPGFQDLHIATPDASKRRIDLELEHGLTMNADLASYGVRLMIFFVTLANHPSPPKLVLLEEPENGVHPKRLKDIVELLLGLSDARYADHPTQVVLTTHSPYLLDSIDVSKNQVLVARRSQDGSRGIEPVSKERLQTFLDEFMLGEVWLNQGEEGLLEKQKQ